MKQTQTFHFERFGFDIEEGDTLGGALRQIADLVDELNARPRGIVTAVDIDIFGLSPLSAAATVNFRLESEEELTGG